MKPLFVCLFFSFLLTFTADIAAQEVKQNPTNAAKMTTKPVASVSAAPKTTPASATKRVVKKVKKSDSPVKKTDKDDAFQDDFDGDIGIKYIGTEQASPEELARVREVERTAKPVKLATKPNAAPMATPAAHVEKVEKVKKTTPTTTSMEAKSVPMAAKEKPVIIESRPVEMPAPAPKPAVKPASKSSGRAHMEFESMTINLGNLKEDAIIDRFFEFTNTGSGNLEILECHGSCGCIQPRPESTIVGPGEKSKIYFKYVARNKVGPQKPVVTLTTNGSPSLVRLFVETWVDQIPGGVKDPAPAPSNAPKTEN
jgi:hypothetical protein